MRPTNSPMAGLFGAGGSGGAAGGAGAAAAAGAADGESGAPTTPASTDLPEDSSFADSVVGLVAACACAVSPPGEAGPAVDRPDASAVGAAESADADADSTCAVPAPILPGIGGRAVPSPGAPGAPVTGPADWASCAGWLVGGTAALKLALALAGAGLEDSSDVDGAGTTGLEAALAATS